MLAPYHYTEAEYSELLDILNKHWRSIHYEWSPPEDWTVLWRHDVDYSPNRARALAKLESDKGIIATYFFQLRSAFYSILEPGMERLVQDLKDLGHDIGVHFDPRPYAEVDKSVLAEKLAGEVEFFKNCFGEPKAFSMHNPTLCPKDFWELGEKITGLPAADSQRYHDGIFYASDSRGGWRRADVPLILSEGQKKKLHILTHPVRWTPVPLSKKGILDRHFQGWSKKLERMLEITASNWRDAIDENNDRNIQDLIFVSRKELK